MPPLRSPFTEDMVTKLGESPAYKHMITALCMRRTEAECMESIEAAQAVANDKDAAYIHIHLQN